MERLATRERGVHLHTLEDHDAEALQERGWRSHTRSDSDHGRFRSKHRTTVPPRSTHVQPGDVSRALIQQGGGRGWGRQLQQQHDGVVVLEQRGSPAGLRQALRKTRRWRGRAAPRGREIRVLGSPKTPTIYRRRGGGCAPSRVPTLGGAAALDGMEGAAKRGREGGRPRVGLRPICA
jgi:hypothetical protein